ncbi:MAG: ATP-binding cassette domain-containing protein [Bdellovibrionota bacterium]
MPADYIIELGTSGGANGGKLIYNGLNEDKHGKEKFEFKSLNNSFLKRASKLSKNEIIIKNATEHNLKNISLNIPLNKMISLVGVSGSGKSTLAKNIIYAEGTEEFL